MYTASFEYRRADTVDEAIDWLKADPDNSKVLAGGHSLLPLMKLSLAQPRIVIDIGRIRALQGVHDEGSFLRIGAYTVYADLARNAVINDFAKLLAQGAASVGDVQVRSRGTIGGSLCHADPQADMPAAVLALDGELIIEGPQGQRTQAVGGFFQAPFITSLAPDELLTAIRIPKLPPHAQSVYRKRPHPASGYPVVGVGAWARITGGVTETCHLAVTGIADLPFRAQRAEEYLQGRRLGAESIREASQLASADALLSGDDDGYKKNLLEVYMTRALWQLAESFE